MFGEFYKLTFQMVSVIHYNNYTTNSTDGTDCTKCRVPFTDWMRWMRPKDSIFMHYRHDVDEDDIIMNKYRYILIPYENLMFVNIQLGLQEENQLYLYAVCRFWADAVTQTVHIEACSCYTIQYDENTLRYESTFGNNSLFETIYARFCGSLNSIVCPFFGNDWKCSVLKNTLCVSDKEWRTAEDAEYYMVCKVLTNPEKSGVYGTFSFEDIQNNASRLIQSTFRGWKARNTYRFNPNTTLGRHLIMKMFYDLLK